ncbi:Ig-like domain-containing protein [Paenibacillus kandeliae]|uniref:Ig-like domain-containing protein n=1 Tax=Paenibacillus kandeliae TaxID=3231269 RepID=UPI00345A9C84
MEKWLKVSLIRVLCVLLVISPFPWAAHTSYAATLSYAQLGSHDFEAGYTSYPDDYLYMGGTSGNAKVSHSFAVYNVPSSFPASGNKAVLSLKVNQIQDNNDGYPPILQVWQYTSATTFNVNDNNAWPASMSALQNDSRFTLLDTKNSDVVKAGATLQFDVDSAVKANAGGSVKFLITGPASSVSSGSQNMIIVTDAPQIIEIAGGAPASAAQSTVSASPTTVTADGTSSSTITVTVKDASSNVLSGKTVTLGKGTSNSTISPASQTTNASGVATFTVTNTKAEQATYTASVAADSVTINQTAIVNFQPGAISASTSTVTTSKANVVADNSDSATISVTLKDANNNAISGQSVTLSQGSGSSTITATQGTTDATGVATFAVKSTKAEGVTYTAMAGGVTVTATATVTFNAGTTNAGLSTITASKANVIANNTDSATITVTLKDGNNNVVSNKVVTLSQGSGSSTITATQGTTDTSGVATFTVKSTKAESVTYTASVASDNVTITPTTSVTFQPGAVSASQSTVGVSKNSVFADGTDSSSVTVTLKDSNSNPISGKNVTLSQGSGSSTINPSTAVTTNANGQAVFTVTNTKKESVTYTATDTDDSITITQTGNVTFTAGAVNAAASSVVASKSTATADGIDSATITVTLKDGNGNAINDRAVTLSQGSGSSTITATQGTTDANGVATFQVTSTKAERVTYTAIAGGVTLTATAGITFQPGAVSDFASIVQVSKSNVAADGTDSSTVTVTLMDEYNNPIAGKSVILSQGSGSSAISPSTGVTTDANGQSSFTVTNMKAETVTYTAKDTTDNVTLTTTKTVTFDPGAVDGALSNVAISKTTVAADNTDTATITVTLRDNQNNAISGKAVTLSQGSGSSTITAIQGTSDANGVATFTVKSTKAEGVTYTAIAGNVTLTLHPVPVTFTPGAASAATSQISASKASVAANGSDSVTITVTVKDTNGNVIAGHTVKLQQGSGSSLVTPSEATTNVDGVATFVVTNTKTENVIYTANVLNENITLSQTVNVNFLSSNANLSSVQLSEGVLIPIFTPSQTSYMASVQNDVYRITFTPTAADLNATIRINGNAVQSGMASTPIELQTGTNTVVIEVLAADGQTTKTYTIQVMREPNKDARLKALNGTPTAITPAFDPAITQYTVNVANNVEQYSVQADVYNPLSTLTVTGATYDSSTNVYSTNLQVGTNTISLKVTAQDGQTSTDYTVNVIRADALTEVKNALNNLTIGYTGNDSWEFVTRDLILPTTQDGLPVTWISNQSQVVQSNGAVTQLASDEATVILTATIQHNGAQLSRTFLVVVKPQGLRIVSSEVTRNVPIRIGDNGADIEQTPITRKLLSDGNKIDKVVAGASQLNSALQAAMTNNESKVRIVATDVPNDPASEVTIDVPSTSYETLANKVDLNLDTEFAGVILSKSTLSQLQTAGQSLFFRFVPIRDAGEVSQVANQALNDPIVKQTVSTGTVAQVGTPMMIETNYNSYNTTLLFPASKLNLPTGTPAQQAAYAAGLYVYIQHSDGEIALQKGTVQTAANGQVEGITINISKFSTFTILHVEPKRSSSGGGGGGGGGTTPAPTPTPSNPSTPTQPSTPAQPGTMGEHTAYINGYPNHTFRPAQTTTRAELAAMLWRVMQANGSSAVTSTSARYSDVPGTHWASDAIRQLQAQQIMMGVSADRFAPNRPLTRAEFATLAVRWQKLTSTGAATASFSDVNGHWAASNIAILVQTGIVKGYSDGTFRPNEGVTRAELVTMMNRLLKRGPLTGVTTSTWSDVPATHWAFGDIEEASLSHSYEIQSDGTEKWISK